MLQILGRSDAVLFISYVIKEINVIDRLRSFKYFFKWSKNVNWLQNLLIDWLNINESEHAHTTMVKEWTNLFLSG